VKSEKAPREATALRPHEVELLLSAGRAKLPFHAYALLLAALRAGLREGELAERWSERGGQGPVHSGSAKLAKPRNGGDSDVALAELSRSELRNQN
jgi:hypothetical protein